MKTPEQIEAALEKAAEPSRPLTEEEREALREVLDWWRTWQAWGKLGKIVLWAIITLGAATAALRETGVLEWLRR